MAGGIPQPIVYKIPLRRVTVETYRLVWAHRDRISRWAIMPLIICTVMSMIFDEVRALGPTDWHFRSFVNIADKVLIALVTIPYQVSIHRLTYPGFDFDRGSYGPTIGKIYSSYFWYTFFLLAVCAVFSYVVLNILSYTVPAYIYYVSPIFISLLQLYFILLFVMIFPAMAVGVKPDLLRAWRLLSGNRFRLAVVIILTTIIPNVLPDVLAYFFDLIDSELRWLMALEIVLNIIIYLALLGLWASCVSLCYYHVTGRQPLAGGVTPDAGEI